MKFLVTPLSGLYNRIFIFGFQTKREPTIRLNQVYEVTSITETVDDIKLQSIKSDLRLRADYNTCVRERTYLNVRKSLRACILRLASRATGARIRPVNTVRGFA